MSEYSLVTFEGIATGCQEIVSPWMMLDKISLLQPETWIVGSTLREPSLWMQETQTMNRMNLPTQPALIYLIHQPFTFLVVTSRDTFSPLFYIPSVCFTFVCLTSMPGAAQRHAGASNGNLRHIAVLRGRQLKDKRNGDLRFGSAFIWWSDQYQTLSDPFETKRIW